jgi:hypothetical protein
VVQLTRLIMDRFFSLFEGKEKIKNDPNSISKGHVLTREILSTIGIISREAKETLDKFHF